MNTNDFHATILYGNKHTTEKCKNNENLDVQQLEDNLDIFQAIDDSHMEELSVYTDFIKENFLVEMPSDFFQFWRFCKKISSTNPQDALKDIGLTLVGPFDVLAGC